MKIEENPADAGTMDSRKATVLQPKEDEVGGCRHADLVGASFYPETAKKLKALLDVLFRSTVTSVTSPYGVLIPHAGYIYSGRCVACAYAKIPETFAGTFVLIGPVLPASSLAAALVATGIPNRPDLLRLQENSLEVHMPFIRYRFPQARVVSVLLGDQSLSEVRCVATAVKLYAVAFYEKLVKIHPSPSMCGYGCIAVMMLVAKQLGALKQK